ncbi:hypothetical protein PR048_003637 [Dryococelus australis]|uniref:Uncharacterized protein n=1 Tax=Dryococelus australis TaxID=614101 RepID=A0ABQ9INR0_9NEOP|nr:hypothetical protein PR048_003637 [Dryococelus australis]
MEVQEGGPVYLMPVHAAIRVSSATSRGQASTRDKMGLARIHEGDKDTLASREYRRPGLRKRWLAPRTSGAATPRMIAGGSFPLARQPGVLRLLPDDVLLPPPAQAFFSPRLRQPWHRPHRRQLPEDVLLPPPVQAFFSPRLQQPRCCPQRRLLPDDVLLPPPVQAFFSPRLRQPWRRPHRCQLPEDVLLPPPVQAFFSPRLRQPWRRPHRCQLPDDVLLPPLVQAVFSSCLRQPRRRPHLRRPPPWLRAGPRVLQLRTLTKYLQSFHITHSFPLPPSDIRRPLPSVSDLRISSLWVCLALRASVSSAITMSVLLLSGDCSRTIGLVNSGSSHFTSSSFTSRCDDGLLRWAASVFFASTNCFSLFFPLLPHAAAVGVSRENDGAHHEVKADPDEVRARLAGGAGPEAPERADQNNVEKRRVQVLVVDERAQTFQGFHVPRIQTTRRKPEKERKEKYLPKIELANARHPERERERERETDTETERGICPSRWWPAGCHFGALSALLVQLLPLHPVIVGATLAERIARSPPTKVNRAQSPARSPDFRQGEIVPDDAAGRRIFLGNLRFPPIPSFRRRSIFTSIALIGSQDLAVKTRPNLFTHSRSDCDRSRHSPKTQEYSGVTGRRHSPPPSPTGINQHLWERRANVLGIRTLGTAREIREILCDDLRHYVYYERAKSSVNDDWRLRDGGGRERGGREIPELTHRPTASSGNDSHTRKCGSDPAGDLNLERLGERRAGSPLSHRGRYADRDISQSVLFAANCLYNAEWRTVATAVVSALSRLPQLSTTPSSNQVTGTAGKEPNFGLRPRGGIHSHAAVTRRCVLTSRQIEVVFTTTNNAVPVRNLIKTRQGERWNTPRLISPVISGA